MRCRINNVENLIRFPLFSYPLNDSHSYPLKDRAYGKLIADQPEERL